MSAAIQPNVINFKARKTTAPEIPPTPAQRQERLTLYQRYADTEHPAIRLVYRSLARLLMDHGQPSQLLDKRYQDRANVWLHVSFTTALGESVVLNVEHPYNNKDYIKSWYSPCQIANRLIAHRGVVSDRCESSNQVEIFLGALLGYGACVVEIVAEGPIIIFEIMLPFTSGHAPMKLVVRKKSE